jgi:hypothetical protein
MADPTDDPNHLYDPQRLIAGWQALDFTPVTDQQLAENLNKLRNACVDTLREIGTPSDQNRRSHAWGMSAAYLARRQRGRALDANDYLLVETALTLQRRTGLAGTTAAQHPVETYSLFATQH